MRSNSLGEMDCSIAQTLDAIGDRWTPLILRDLFMGISRFDVFQRNMGISRKVLAERLAALVDEGIVSRAAYQDNPPRYDYSLTEKGEDLGLVLVAMMTWGERWAPKPEGARMRLRHETCGNEMGVVPTCSECGEFVHARDVTPIPGPGFEPGPGTEELEVSLARLLAART